MILVLDRCNSARFDGGWDSEDIGVGFVEISKIFGIQDDYLDETAPCDRVYS